MKFTSTIVLATLAVGIAAFPTRDAALKARYLTLDVSDADLDRRAPLGPGTSGAAKAEKEAEEKAFRAGERIGEQKEAKKVGEMRVPSRRQRSLENEDMELEARKYWWLKRPRPKRVFSRDLGVLSPRLSAAPENSQAGRSLANDQALQFRSFDNDYAEDIQLHSPCRPGECYGAPEKVVLKNRDEIRQNSIRGWRRSLEDIDLDARSPLTSGQLKAAEQKAFREGERRGEHKERKELRQRSLEDDDFAVQMVARSPLGHGAIAAVQNAERAGERAGERKELKTEERKAEKKAMAAGIRAGEAKEAKKLRGRSIKDLD